VADALRHRDETLASLFNVQDRVALVTGGASGLGLAIAGILADCGARVIVADRDEQRLRAAVADLSARGRADAAVVDVSDGGAMAHVAKSIVARYGRLDVAFANAGIGGGRPPPARRYRAGMTPGLALWRDDPGCIANAR